MMPTDNASRGFIIMRVQRINSSTTSLDMMFNMGRNAPFIRRWTSPMMFMTRSDEFLFRKNSYSCIRYCLSSLLDKATHCFLEYLISSQLQKVEKRLYITINNKEGMPSMM